MAMSVNNSQFDPTDASMQDALAPFMEPDKDKKLGKKKKKKKRKKRLTKTEKDKLALEKKITDLKQSGEPFQMFIDRMDKWLFANETKITELFDTFDSEGIGMLTYDQFRGGMLDLDVPCNDLELHLLCNLLDRDRCQMISIKRMLKGLGFLRDREENYRLQDIRPPLEVTKRSGSRCSNCAMSTWNGESFKVQYPRYMDVMFRLLSFDGVRSHPGHFNKVVPSHLTVYHLMQFIREETAIETTKIVIFTDKSREESGLLPEEQTLEECGFIGGTKSKPKELLLYYDYVIEFAECPLLLCDHYFGRRIKVVP